MSADYALAADLGGTQMRAALVDRQGRVSHKRAAPTQAHQGRDDVLRRLVALLQDVASRVPREAIAGVGLALAGPTDPQTGTLYNPPNLPGWDRFSPVPALEEALGLPVYANNDANLAALAEHRYGAGRGSRHMVYMTVSTGIGGGIIIDGRLYTGRRGFAGEIGHMSIDRHGPVCNCGNAGCLEALASGTAVARMARERLARGEASVLRQHQGDGPDSPDARMVAEAARAGDALARAVMEEAATNLGIGIVSLLSIFDPEVIVIGGGMARDLDLLLSAIAAEVERHAMVHLRDLVPVVRSLLGDDVSLIGAGEMVFAREQ